MSDLNQLFAPLTYNIIYNNSVNWISISCSSNGQYVVACANGNYVYLSSNYGLNPWTQISDIGNWFGLCMDDSGQNIVAVSSPGYIYYLNSGRLIQSTSIQSNWQSVSSRMYLQNNVYAVESPGYIWKSTDKGKTWTKSNSISSNWTSISTDQLNHVVALEQVGYIYYSTNGIDWNKSDSLNKNWAYVTCSNSGNYFFANAANDYIYVSTNYGINWRVLQFSPIQNWARITCSYDGSYVAATSFDISLYTSSNYGQRWYKQINSIPGNWNFPICDSTGEINYFTGNSSGLYSMITTSLTNFAANDVDLNQIFNAYNNVWQQTSAPSGNWTSISTSYSGQYVASMNANSGLYVSTNYGSTWSVVFDPITFGIVAMDGNGVYVYVTGRDVGIYAYNITTNVTTIIYQNNIGISCLATNKSSGQYIFAGFTNLLTLTGYIFSNNYGQTFGVGNIIGVIPTSAALSDDGTNIYFCDRNNYIWRSSNSGVTFNSLTSSPQKNWQSIVCSSNGQYVVASANTTTTIAGIWTSNDYGSTWIQTNAPSNQEWGILTCNQTGQYIYATTKTSSVWVSLDFGLTWKEYPNTSFYSITSSSTSQYVYGSGVYIYKLAKLSNSNFLSKQIDLSLLYNPLIVTWNNSQTLLGLSLNNITSNSTGQYLATVAYNNFIYTSSNYGQTWIQRYNSGPWNLISMDSTGTNLIAAQSPGYIYYSTNGGSTWNISTMLITSRWQNITRKTYSGQNAYIIDIGSFGIWKTTNKGESWTQCNSLGAVWVSITMSSNAQIVYAVQQGGGIYKSSNSGINWSQTSAPSLGWNAISCDKTGQYIVACVVNGVGIYTSNDYGITWILTTAPQISYINVISSNNGSTIYAVAKNGQIYSSTNYGKNWIVQSSSPIMIWNSITCDDEGINIAASTSGSGIYYTTIKRAPTTNFITNNY
jgi:photosystem II stability/assembly factor-like uncharacterized protein